MTTKHHPSCEVEIDAACARALLLFTGDKESSSALLSRVAIVRHKDKVSAVATNGHVLAVLNLEVKRPDVRFPRSAKSGVDKFTIEGRHLARMAHDDDLISLKFGDRLRVEAGGLRFETEWADDFPDYLGAFPGDAEGDEVPAIFPSLFSARYLALFKGVAESEDTYNRQVKFVSQQSPTDPLLCRMGDRDRWTILLMPMRM